MAIVAITGGTGLIGRALTSALRKKGYEVIILTRGNNREKNKAPGLSYAQWDINKGWIAPGVVEAADYIVHLAGANVADGRWTAKRKKEIINSRVDSGRTLVKALRETPNHVQAVISASAIGWYGPDPVIPNPHPFIETDPAAADFLGTTCKQWESAIEPAANLQKRLVTLRTGIVLTNEGGAFAEFKKPLNFGAATILGSGKQVVSWIHIDDIVSMYIAAIERENWRGIYNAVAPMPVSNADLIKQIAKEWDRTWLTMHVPAWALKAALGEMSIEVLKSTTVSAGKALKEGFVFAYPTLEPAIQKLLTS